MDARVKRVWVTPEMSWSDLLDEIQRENIDLKEELRDSLWVYRSDNYLEQNQAIDAMYEMVEKKAGKYGQDPVVILVLDPITKRQRLNAAMVASNEMGLGTALADPNVDKLSATIIKGIVRTPALKLVGFLKKLGSAVLHSDDFLEFKTSLPKDFGIIEKNRMYIRASYLGIHEQIEVHFKNCKDSVGACIVTGTPGIGKSMFALYLMWKFVLEKRRVLLVYSPLIIYFDGERYWRWKRIPKEYDLDPGYPHEHFWRTDLTCLFDCKDEDGVAAFKGVPYTRCRFIITTSPKLNLFNDISKQDCTTLYMPVWSLDELSRVGVQYGVAERQWKRVYESLGGIPRFMFPTDRNYRVALDEAVHAIQAMPYESLKEISRWEDFVYPSSGKPDKLISHRFLHMHSDPPYKEHKIRFATDWARRFVISKYEKAFENFWNDVISCDQKGPFSIEIGNRYEAFALERLAEGGNFRYCRLIPGRRGPHRQSEEFLTLLRSDMLVVDKVEDSQSGLQFYKPLDPKYPGIDAWMPDVGVFQLTTDLDHALNPSILVDLPLLRQGAHKLFWVLREHEYEKFKAKTLKKDHPYSELEQYALLVPSPNFREADLFRFRDDEDMDIESSDAGVDSGMIR
jgi:hypothetical protein